MLRTVVRCDEHLTLCLQNGEYWWYIDKLIKPITFLNGRKCYMKVIILITTKQNNCFKKENLKDKKL